MPSRATGHHVITDKSISAQDTFTDPIEVSEGLVSVSLSGTFSATVTLQRQFEGLSTWVDVKTYTAIDEENLECPEPMSVRIGIKTGNYTSGTVVLHLGQMRIT